MSPYWVFISSNHNIHLMPCSCRGVAELWRSTRSMLIRVNCCQVLQLGCNRAPTFCNTYSTKLQVSDHVLIAQIPKSAQLSLPPTRVFLMSPLITRRCNHSGGFAICLIRPAPRRIAMACIQLDLDAKTVDSIT